MELRRPGKAKKNITADQNNLKRTFLGYRDRLAGVFTKKEKNKTTPLVPLQTTEISPKVPPAPTQQRIEESKYYSSPVPQYKNPQEFQFPSGYGDNKIVIMVRDPWWIFAYWEIAHQKENEVKSLIGQKGLSPLKAILRIYDVTDRKFDGKNANSYFDIDLSGLANNWYINVGNPNRSWIVDIGILASNNEFFLLARSNCVKTPLFGMSDIVDEEWMCQEEDYWKMFGLSGGFGVGKGSLAMREMFKKRLMEQISSVSGAVSSLSSPVKRIRPPKGFWLVVDCELIVYGRTEPDAKVTVQGQSVVLRKDGTFTLRYALPDGKQEIPVVATNFDGDDTRTITPIVTRRTV